MVLSSHFLFFFFKQKTAYEMRISDWSSDVCSSDLPGKVGDLRSRRKLDCLKPAASTPSPLVAASRPCQTSATIEAGLRLRCLKLQIGRASCRERVCQYV